jgi:hypothetical protein
MASRSAASAPSAPSAAEATQAWTCRVCSHENAISAETVAQAYADGGRRCALCAAPRPRPSPTELIATLPLAGVLLVIGICLPLVGNDDGRGGARPPSPAGRPFVGFIGTDMASFITFSHTMLLGAFGTVACLSRNPLFGASVQLALVLGTIVGACGTLLMQAWLSSCRVDSTAWPLSLAITISFTLAASGGAATVLRSRRYPIFAVSAASRSSRLTTCFRSLKVWLLMEFSIICLSMVARTLSILLVSSSTAMATACDDMAAGHSRGWIVKAQLTGFVESFHVAFHESFLLGCGFAALWSRGFYVDLLALSSVVFGVFYTVHAVAASVFMASANTPLLGRVFSDAEQTVTLILRAVIKWRIFCIAMRMRREMGRTTNQQKRRQQSTGNLPNNMEEERLSWVQYTPIPTIFDICCGHCLSYSSDTNLRSLRANARARIGAGIVAASGICTAISFHAESVLLLLFVSALVQAEHSNYNNLNQTATASATAAAAATAVRNRSLALLKQSFPAFNFGIHGIMVLPYLIGFAQSLRAYGQFRLVHVLLSLVAAAGSAALATFGLQRYIQQSGDTFISASNLGLFLRTTVLCRSIASAVMALGFLVLVPGDLSEIAKGQAAGRADANGEEEVEAEEKGEKDEDVRLMPRASAEQGCAVDRASSEFGSSGINANSAGTGMAFLSSSCSHTQMVSLRRWHKMGRRLVYTFVLSSASFVVVVVSIVVTSPASSHHSQTSLPHEILPESLGYSLIFHIAFLLPIFTLHGLRTGSLQTLRVGICFAASSAVLMAIASAVMGQYEMLAGLVLAACAASAGLLCAWSSRFYCRLRAWRIKAAALAREDSSFMQVFT